MVHLGTTKLPAQVRHMSQVEPAQRRADKKTAISGRASAKTPILQSVLSTSELNCRPSRSPDLAAENRALILLAEQLAASPGGILQKLVETALTLCAAQSAGISLLESDGKKFYWPAIAGQWAEQLGGAHHASMGRAALFGLQYGAPIFAPRT